MEYVSKYGIVHFHDTPWNSKSLLGKSLEIDSIESSTNNLMDTVLEFCKQKSNESYILVASRISASLINLKKVYYDCGFVAVEHIMNASVGCLDLNKTTSLLNKFHVDVDDYTSDNIREIEEIVALEFNFGRFHEDPYVNPIIAKNRNRNWIKNIITQESTIKVLKKNNTIVGFIAYKIKDSRAELILGGVKEKYRHLAYGFCANILLGLGDVKEINALISSSNIDIINLYSYFGFKFSNPRIGFHKHL